MRGQHFMHVTFMLSRNIPHLLLILWSTVILPSIKFMILRSRSVSISTVPFKRLLSSNSSTAGQTNENGPKPLTHLKLGEEVHLDRLEASVAGSESTHFTYSYLTHSFLSNSLKNSAKKGFLTEGRKLHGQLFKLGHYNDVSLKNQLLNIYAKCKQIHDARRVFDEMSLRDIITWNTLISGVANCEAGFRWILYLGFSYFKRMLSEMVRPDYITFISLLAMSNGLNDIEIGRQLHCLLVKLGFGLDKFVISALLDFYSKFGLVEYARRSFDCCLEKDTVVWNGMVSCYASNSLPKEAFSVFRQMQLEGVKGDGFTFSSLLNSTIMLRFSEFGRQLHGLVIRLSFDLDMVVASALVDMYAKNDNIVDARKAFDEMIFKNIVVWNTMIVGYGKIGEGKEAMKLLLKMFQSNLCPDELTLASVLSSCGNMSSCTEIMQVHAYTIRKGFQNFISISNSLINAYSKSGSIALALKCYGSISEPDLVSWTSMIVAYGFHGLPKESVELFEKMIRNGITPDRVAFLGVLSACSHGGLVNEGLHYFNLMINYYHIEPDLEHYTCLVDLLGRAGLLHEAFYVLTLNPIELGSDMLGSFIGACNVHRNSKLAKWAAEKLFVLNPEEPLNYSILSNVYASDGCWLDVARVHKMMKSSGNHKVPGCSLIEIAGELHTFISGDKLHLGDC